MGSDSGKAVRRIPKVPTVLVLLAVAVMVRLGFWQLERLADKEAMLAQFQQELSDPGQGYDLNRVRLQDHPSGYRIARVTCDSTGPDQPRAGRSKAGQPGWVHAFQCNYRPARGGTTFVRIYAGWSASPTPASWTGGEVTGRIIPESMNNRLMWHILADPPVGGLEANASPDPSSIPNNHLSYAIQWFLFALTALVIYALALRKRFAA